MNRLKSFIELYLEIIFLFIIAIIIPIVFVLLIIIAFMYVLIDNIITLFKYWIGYYDESIERSKQ